MSLQVWLPLNGNIQNQGVSDLTFSILSSSNTTVSNSGKIGKCYTNNSFSAGGLLSNKTINLGSQQSMFCWFKFTSLNSSSSLGGNLVSQHRYASNAGMGISIKYVSSTTGYLSVNTGNGSSRTYNTYCGTTLLQADTWYHGGYTYDGTNIRIYVNGVLEKTQAYANMSVPADYLTVFCWSMSGTSGSSVHGDYKLNGSLNDVRIYDHCLSQKEVQELAKGLVLHYKMNQAVGLTDLGKKTFSVYNNYGVTNSMTTLTETYQGYPIRRVSMTPASGNVSNFQTSLYSHGVYNGTYTFKASTKYCYWIYYRAQTNKSDLRAGGTASNIGGWTEIPPVAMGDGWYRVGQYRDGSVTSDKTDNVFTSFYTPSAVAGTAIVIDWGPSFLVEGITEIPENCDFTGNILFDSSGFKNHSIVGGILNTYSDTKRYQKSSYFGEHNTPYTSLSDTSLLPALTNCTITYWAKYDTTTTLLFTGQSTSYYIMASSANNYYHAQIGSPTVYKNGVAGTYQCTAGSWDFFAVKGVNLSSWTQLKLNSYSSAWRLRGLLSDLRIYATPLTDAQIKELYDTSMTIDKSGNIYARELVEQ